MVVSFIMKQEVIGLLTIGEKSNGQPIDEVEYDYIKHIANQASYCLNACNLYMKRQNERQELDKILKNLISSLQYRQSHDLYQ